MHPAHILILNILVMEQKVSACGFYTFLFFPPKLFLFRFFFFLTSNVLVYMLMSANGEYLLCTRLCSNCHVSVMYLVLTRDGTDAVNIFSLQRQKAAAWSG